MAKVLVLWSLFLGSLAMADSAKVDLQDDFSGFELSGRLAIVILGDDSEREAPEFKTLADRLEFFTGYAPVIRGKDQRGHARSIVFLIDPSRKADSDLPSIRVDPTHVLIVSGDKNGAARAACELAKMLRYDSEILTRSESQNWAEIQKPDRLCRWIYSLPSMNLTFQR